MPNPPRAGHLVGAALAQARPRGRLPQGLSRRRADAESSPIIGSTVLVRRRRWKFCWRPYHPLSLPTTDDHPPNTAAGRAPRRGRSLLEVICRSDPPPTLSTTDHHGPHTVAGRSPPSGRSLLVGVRHPGSCVGCSRPTAKLHSRRPAGCCRVDPRRWLVLAVTILAAAPPRRPTPAPIYGCCLTVPRSSTSPPPDTIAVGFRSLLLQAAAEGRCLRRLPRLTCRTGKPRRLRLCAPHLWKASSRHARPRLPACRRLARTKAWSLFFLAEPGSSRSVMRPTRRLWVVARSCTRMVPHPQLAGPLV